jgi:hypothetical protein
MRYRDMRQSPLLQRAKSLPLVLSSEAAASKPLFWFRPLQADTRSILCGHHAWAPSPSDVKSTNMPPETNLNPEDTEVPEEELVGLCLLEGEEAW